MILYIVRHGQTKWNVQKRLQGASDTDLNENGIALAKVTGEALKEVPFSCCFTSPLKRARETAELVLGERKNIVPVYPDDRIREISFGVWEGQDSTLLPQEMLDNFFHHPEKYQPPQGGEALSHILERTRDFWQDITSREELQDKTVLVASHGCCIRALLHNVYKDAGLENYWHGTVPPNCCVNVVEVRDGKAVLLEEDKIYYE